MSYSIFGRRHAVSGVGCWAFVIVSVAIAAAELFFMLGPALAGEGNGLKSNDVAIKVSTNVQGKQFDFPSLQSINTKQLNRIRKLKKNIRHRSAYHRFLLRKTYRRGIAGASELRICSLNLAGFGDKAGMKKLFGTKIGAEYLRRLNAVSSALRSDECEVVALQGIVGMNRAGAVAGLKKIEERLSKADSKAKWQSLLADSRARNTYVGFLYRGDIVENLGMKSYMDVLLPGLKGFDLQKFAVGPAELTLRVHKKLGSGSKTLELVSFMLSSLDYGAKLTPRDSLQMAEGLRRLYTIPRNSRNRLLYGDDVLVVLAGETGSPYRSITRRVLEGRSELKQFNEGGLCRVDEVKHKKSTELVPVCEKLVSAPIQFWGVNSMQPIVSRALVKCSGKEQTENAPETFVKGRPTADRWCWRNPSVEQRKVMGEKKYKGTADIFLKPADLRFVMKPESYSFGKLPLSSNRGYREIVAGSLRTALVRIDLNW